MEQNNLYAVKKAHFPFSVILWVFKKTMCSPNCRVAMIDPIFLNIVTIGKPYELPAKLYNHEARHIEQVKENGRVKFIFKYLWYNIRYGYKNNPFEIDAKKHEDL